jgi:Fe-S cluster assembly iron-binding protein IscA
MLIVTPQAKQKLVEALHENTHDPCMAIRITVNPKAPRQLDLILDREKRGDFVVKTHEGLKLLLIQAHLASRLEGLVLDYEDGLKDFVIAELTRH